MLYTSTSNPDVRSTGELIVLSHKGSNILVPLSLNYCDMVNVAKREFRLSVDRTQTITLQTTDIAGYNPPLNVEIHKDAWESICRVITRIYVHVVSSQDTQQATRAASFNNLDITPIPSRKTSMLTPSSSTSSQTGTSIAAQAGPSNLANVPTQSNESQHAAELRPITPARRYRPRVMSDAYEAEQNEDMAEEVSSSETTARKAPVSPRSERKRKSPSYRRSGELDDTMDNQAGPSAQTSVKQGQSSGLKTETQVPEEQHAEQTNDATQRSPRKRPRLSGQDDVRAHPNENFIVIIEYGDVGSSSFKESLFNVKGKHSVRKVLSMACQILDVKEEDRKSAHLVLIHEDQEGDDIIEHRFECANEMSMAEAGAYPDARFVIAIGDDDD